MKLSKHFLLAFLLALVPMLIVAGCASSGVTARRQFAKGPIPKPGRIIVYDFVATPQDIDEGSVISPYVQLRTKPQTPSQKEMGRKLGNLMAGYLVKDILDLGMPAERENTLKPARVDDLIIKGELYSIEEGSRMKRMIIGFGAGSNELRTHVVGYQLTPGGLRRLGEGEFKAAGGKMPGIAVPVVGGAIAGSAAISAAVAGGLNVAQEVDPESMEGAAKRTAKEITKVLSRVFVREGWIPPHKAQ